MASLEKPTRWYALKSLDGTQALKLLVEALRQAAGASHVHVEEHLRFRIKVAVYGAAVDIYIPETGDVTGPARKTAPALFNLLKQHYRETTRREPEVGSPPEDAGKLQNVLALLLQSADGTREAPAEQIHSECLLLSPHPITAALASMLFGKIRLQATDVRCAPAALGDQQTFCFWVKDDIARQSNFGALTEELQQNGYIKLDAFRAGSWIVFLPPEEQVRPGRALLELFCELIQICSTLYRQREAVCPSEGPLLALARHGSELTAFYLGNVHFHEKDLFERDVQQELRLSWRSLEHSEAAKQNLVEVMKNAVVDYRGYRLELMRTEVGSTDAVREQRLEEQIAYLDSRLHLLRTARESRPTLLCFRQSQLAAFADVLRRTPMKYLQDQRMLYGFFADRTPRIATREGFVFPDYCTHYLWFEPGWMDLDGANPFLNWTGEKNGPRKFWLDPYWARYYSSGQGVNSLVFVPESSALFPTMHGWTAPDMDDYLRRTLHDLLPETVRQKGLGTTPVYVFDGEDSPGVEIEVTVLDKAQFVPFSEKLDWLNDHIRTLDALESAPQVFARMTRSADTLLLARELGKEAKDFQRRVASEIKSAHQDLEGQIEAALQNLDTVIAEFSAATEQDLEKARKFNQDHSALRAELEHATGDVTALLRAMTAAEAAGKTAELRLSQAALHIQARLAAVRSRRQALEDEVAAEVKNLRQLRENTLRLLGELHGEPPRPDTPYS